MFSKGKTLAGLRKVVRRGFDGRYIGLGKAEIAELALRHAMASRRSDIRKSAGARSGLRRQRVAAQRYARDRARRLKKLFLIRRSWGISSQHLLRERIPSPILDRLDHEREVQWRPIVARQFKRVIPRVALTKLNFLDDPVGTIEQFRKLSQIERQEVNAYLDFDDDHCMDVGAYLVIAEIWPQLSKIFHGGKMSQAVQKVLSAIQLDQELGIGLGGVRDHKDVWAFPVRHRRPRGTTTSDTANLQPQEREKVADHLCDLFDKWLEVSNTEKASSGCGEWELSPEGKSLLARMTGELLDNAERHSDPNSSDGDWSTTAFMAARAGAGGQRELRCYLAFLSVGQSIAETMANAPPELLVKADAYLGRFAKSAVSRDTLLTVLALQDAITSDAKARREGRGGTGFQDVLELIGDLGAAHSVGADVRATIVSGRTCIRLRHPNLMGTRDGAGRRVQWCNVQNDPRDPPDADIAFELPAHFGGTLVSVGFTLDSRLFVPDSTEGNDREN